MESDSTKTLAITTEESITNHGLESMENKVKSGRKRIWCAPVLTGWSCESVLGDPVRWKMEQ